MSGNFVSHDSGQSAPALPDEGSCPPFGNTGQFLQKISEVSYDMRGMMFRHSLRHRLTARSTAAKIAIGIRSPANCRQAVLLVIF